jgi:hypothetical protein
MFALAASVLVLALAAINQIPEKALRGKVSVGE